MKIISKSLMSELLNLKDYQTMIDVDTTTNYSNMELGVWYKYEINKKEKYGVSNHTVEDCINVYELMAIAKHWASQQGLTISSYTSVDGKQAHACIPEGKICCTSETEYLAVFNLCELVHETNKMEKND